MPLYLFSALAAAVTVAGIAIVVWLGCAARRIPPSPRRIGASLLLISYGAALVLRPNPWAVIDLAVLAGAIGGVIWLEAQLREPIAIAVFLSVAAVVDLTSVIAGPSHALIEALRGESSRLLLYLALVAPFRGQAIPIVGISDLFVGGSAAVALIHLKMKPLTIIGAIVAALLSALACGLWLGPAPALPFVALAVWPLVLRHAQRSPSR